MSVQKTMQKTKQDWCGKMASITIHTCGNEICGYYQEPYNDYPERGMNECMGCNEYFCDECSNDHAFECWLDHSKLIMKKTKCDWCDKASKEEDINRCGLCEENYCEDCGKEHANECFFG